MTVLLIASLNVLVWGLSLMVLWRTLTMKSAGSAETVARLMRIGLVILVAGVLILAIGTWIFGQRPQDGIAVTSIGGTVIALSAATIFSALGHGHENTGRVGAWVVIGIGALGFLVVLIAQFFCPLLRA